jgi:AraC-like DNA-binding protein
MRPRLPAPAAAVLYVLDVDEPCQVVAWHPPVAGITEVFHARISDYRYPAHCHDDWTLLIVDDGAIEYDLDDRHHGAVRELVTILPPGVAHTGYPASGVTRFRKRNLYLAPGFLPVGLTGRAVDGPAWRDRELRAAVSALHDRLVAPDRLDVESRLALIAERLESHLRARPPARPGPEPGIAGRLKAYLDERVTTGVTLGEAATVLDRSVPHLVRSFRHTYRISPYAYVVGVRVERARKMLLAGRPIADVAAATGFTDQSHLTRHFRRHVATSPGRYAASAARYSGGSVAT